MTAAELPGTLFVTEFRAAAMGESSESAENADAVAMGRLARGDIGALGELYDRHQAAVRRFATRMTGSSDDGSDVVHATFLAALRTAGAFDGKRSCRAWLLGIAARLIQRRRSTLARWTRLLRGFRVAEPSWAPDPERAFGAREGIERGLAHLSEAKRGVLLMADVEGLSGEEIAEALQIPIGTVWTRLHHARRELMTALAAEKLP